MNLQRHWLAWCEFWFGERSLWVLGLFRASLGVTMLSIYISRHFEIETFFGANSIVSKDQALMLFPEFQRSIFPWFFWPDSMAGLVHGIYLLLLVLIAVGLNPRIVTFAAWVLHFGFIQRNFSIAFGADIISGIFLLYLSLTQSHLQFSLWGKVFKKSAQQSADLFTSIFYRLIQMQLCLIYAYTGFEKLRGQTWWDGTALWTVFANPQMVIMDLTWLVHLPLVIVGITFATVFWEIYFPILVWIPKLRPITLFAGVCFHLGIAFLIGLHGFAFTMMSPYLLFLKEASLKKALNQLTFNRFSSLL